MKIAYIYDAIYPWVKGGAEKRIHELSRRLAERGHEVHCYGMKWWQGDREILQDGVYLHAVCPPMPLYRNGKRSIRQAAFFAGKLLLVPVDGDVIDCQNFPYLSCFSAKLLSSPKGQKFFITWHEVWGDYWCEYLGNSGLIGQSIEWTAARLTEKNIVVSDRTHRQLLSLGAKGIRVVPNGIDCRKILGIAPSPEQSDIVCLGRLVEHKNVHLLIEALGMVRKEVPQVKALIIGDGPEMARLKGLVGRLDLEKNVSFLGFLEDYNEALALMKSSGIFASPSIREGFGMAALEANACGLPVVTVSHGMNAVMDLVKEDTGTVCQPTAQALAEAICSTLQNREKMRMRCMEEAGKYDWEKVCDLAERVYNGKSGL
jgi:glycosyltransferase involved in cell wall biosynthesis